MEAKGIEDEIIPCKICGFKSKLIFKRLVLKRFEVKYFQCTKCGFASTEKPFWLEFAYNESINLGDTGQVQRLLENSVKTKFVILEVLNPNGKYLDYAGGYGMFVRAMRDFGFNFFWEDKYTPNLIAKGFNANSDEEIFFEAITVFECFEHWESPLHEIELLFQRTDTIIFSTNLISFPAPVEWWYYGFDHGQHISFFSRLSFKEIEKKLDCKFYTKNGIHILTKKPISNFFLKIALLKAKAQLNFFKIGNLTSLTTTDHNNLIS